MKYYTLSFIFALYIAGCTSNYEPSIDETKKIHKEATKLLKANNNETIIKKSQWPPIFTKINAKSVILKRHGLYIQLTQSFTEESGLFVPSEDIEVETSTENDPSYEVISNGVYKYKIKG